MSPRVLVVLIAALVFGSGAWPGTSPNLSVWAAGHTNVRAGHTAQTGVVPSRHLNSIRLSTLPRLPARSANQPFFRGSPATRPTATPKSVAQITRPLIPINPPVVYNGLNKPGMTAGLSMVTPPDSTGAIGPGNYIEMDNAGVTVYNRNTLAALSSVSLDTFAGVAAGIPLCDPQIEWDPAANRWLYSILICTSSTTGQGVAVGWSKTWNPADGWCNGHVFPFNSLVLDFQKLGHNANYMIVGGNFYDYALSFNNPPFVGAAVFWTPLPRTGDTTCPTTLNANIVLSALKNGDGTTFTFTPVPVNTDSNATDGYVFSAYDPAGNVGGIGPQGKLAVFHLDGAGVFHQDPDIAVTQYQAPIPAQQADGGAHLIDTLDARLTQVEGDPATGMYMQHTVLDSSHQRSEVDWYEVTGSGSALTLVQQGAIDTPSSWTYNAAIAPRSDGQGAAIFYNVSNSTLNPEIVAQIRRPSTPSNSFETGTLVLATSSAADMDFSCNNPTTAFPCRWGDYAAATPDPTKPYLVWGTGEINTAGGSNPGWANQNYAIVVAVKPPPPTNVHATSDGRGEALVTWEPPVDAGGSPVRDYDIDAFRNGLLTPFAHLTIRGALATSGQFQGLTGGTTYTFEVRTETLYGTSDVSLPSNAITIAGVNQSTSPSPPPRGRAAQSTPTPPPTR